MRAVVQRVSSASVVIDGKEKRSIGKGLAIFVGVKEGDDEKTCAKLADKCANLRIFNDEDGKMNLSATSLNYEALIISNFTLYASTKKGKRPDFLAAAKPPLAVDLYNYFVNEVEKTPLKNVVTGEFGAHMDVELVNDGPITIILDTDEWNK